MEAPKKPTRAVDVYVNAGPTRVMLNRTDGQAWAAPLYLNLPLGVREFLIEEFLVKKATPTGEIKATNNVVWNLDPKMIQRGTFKGGESMGKPLFFVKIEVDYLETWLGELRVSPRGKPNEVVQNVLDRWKNRFKKNDSDNNDASF